MFPFGSGYSPAFSLSISLPLSYTTRFICTWVFLSWIFGCELRHCLGISTVALRHTVSGSWGEWNSICCRHWLSVAMTSTPRETLDSSSFISGWRKTLLFQKDGTLLRSIDVSFRWQCCSTAWFLGRPLLHDLGLGNIANILNKTGTLFLIGGWWIDRSEFETFAMERSYFLHSQTTNAYFGL